MDEFSLYQVFDPLVLLFSLSHTHTCASVFCKHENVCNSSRFLFISLSLQGLSRFEVLQELDISENDVVFLPPSVGQLLNLKELNISKNGETPFL